MELVLNLVWALLAVAIVRLWLRHAPKDALNHRTQVAALLLLLLILFPVISVTDDLAAMQNPAEVESCLRRSHGATWQHSIFPDVFTLPANQLAEFHLRIEPWTAVVQLPVPFVDNPALAPIQNRPPPAA